MTATEQESATRHDAGPAQGFSRRLGLWAIGAGVVGALALPIWRVGIGWPIAALALLGTIAVARFARDGGEAGTPRRRCRSDRNPRYDPARRRG